MRRLIVVLLLIVEMIIACNTGKGKKQDPTPQDSIKNEGEILVENIYPPEYKRQEENDAPFDKILAAIPITPLPIGFAGIDTITVWKSLNKPFESFELDSLNKFGLNNYFKDHPELDIEYDEGDSGYLNSLGRHYFSRRLPRTKNNEEVLLFYDLGKSYDSWGDDDITYTLNRNSIERIKKEKPDQSWTLFFCDPKTGKLTRTLGALFVLNKYSRSIGYIDSNYNWSYKKFQKEVKLFNLDLQNEYPEQEKKDKTFLSFSENQDINKKEYDRRYYFWRKGQAIAYEKIAYKGKEQVCIFVGTDTIPVNRKGEPIEEE